MSARNAPPIVSSCCRSSFVDGLEHLENLDHHRVDLERVLIECCEVGGFVRVPANRLDTRLLWFTPTTIRAGSEEATATFI
jgi:hypothetical protein